MHAMQKTDATHMHVLYVMDGLRPKTMAERSRSI